MGETNTGNLEIRFSREKYISLNAFIRESKTKGLTILVRFYRNLFKKHIDYPRVWFKIIQELKIKSNSSLLVELYPSEAGNLRGSLEDEIALLDEENSAKDIFIKNHLPEYNLDQYVFAVDSLAYLKKLLISYYAHFQITVYMVHDSSIRYTCAHEIATGLVEKTPDQLRTLVREYAMCVFSFNFSGVEMCILSNSLREEELRRAIKKVSKS